MGYLCYAEHYILMKVGDMVKATEGQIAGMLGVVTKLVATGRSLNCADVFWNNGDHQSFVSMQYLEVVQKND